ncbi:MAG: hypothetical protein QM648_02335 [Solirubrobacterales bacterium]
MKRPATSGGRRKAPARSRAAAARPAAPKRAGAKKSEPQIKVTRNSPRPQIKASRGPGGPVKRRKVAPSSRGKAAPRSVSEVDRRVAETRRQSLSTMGQASPRPRSGGSRGAASAPRGGGSVRAVAVGAGGGAAAGAARVVQEVARPVTAVTRPVLRVVSGGIEAIPQAANRATPIARGRMLILLVGVLAAGLIYINVGKLEYGDGYAKYAERSLELQRENTVLRSRIANLGAAQRIKLYAEKQGMVMPAPEQFEYLSHRRGDAARAAKNLTAPLTAATPTSAGPTAATGATVATGVATDTGAGL